MTLPVSILIPCYNADEHLSQCLESAIAQNAAEIILIDDGSTDNSLEIANGYSEHITVISQANQGSQPTRNNLFNLSTQNWVQYLDADDYLLPNKIQYQLDHAGTASVLYCNFSIERTVNGSTQDEIWRIDPDFVKALILFSNPGQTNAFLYRRDWLSKVSWNTTDLYKSGIQNHRLNLDLLKVGATFQHVDFTGFVHRKGWSANQITDASKTQARLTTRKDFHDDLISWVEATYPDKYTSEIELINKRFNIECQLAGVN